MDVFCFLDMPYIYIYIITFYTFDSKYFVVACDQNFISCSMSTLNSHCGRMALADGRCF